MKGRPAPVGRVENTPLVVKNPRAPGDRSHPTCGGLGWLRARGTATADGTPGPVAGDAAPDADPHDDPAYVTRTKFLSGVALVTGGVLTAAILVPVIGFAVAESVKDEEWRWVDVGPLRDYPDGEVGSIAVSGPSPESDRRAYLRHKEGAIIAIWNRCAHLGCPVAYSAGGDVYSCPCHGGAYDSHRPGHRRPAAAAARPLRRQDRHPRGQGGRAAGGARRRVPDGRRRSRGPGPARAALLDRRGPAALRAQGSR